MTPAQATLAFGWVALLILGILTAWVRDRWAVAAFQIGFFSLGSWWLLRLSVRPAPLALPQFVLIPLALVSIGAAQLIGGGTVNLWETLNSTGNWLTHLIAMVLAAQFASVTRLRNNVREVLFWFGGSIAILGIVQNLTSGGKVFWLFDSGFQSLVLGPFVYRNKFAQFLELLLPLAVFRAAERPRRAAVSLAVAAMMLAGTVAAGSRSGFVVMLAETLTLLIVLGRGPWLREQRALKIATQTILWMVVCAGLVGWEFLHDRFQMDFRDDVRLPIMLATADMIKERPWTGYGLGAWSSAYGQFARIDTGLFVNQAHCDWLQWWAEGGILGLLIMVALAVQSVRVGLERPWALGVPFVLLHGFVDYPMQQVPQFATLVLALFALAAGVPPGRSAGAAASWYRSRNVLEN